MRKQKLGEPFGWKETTKGNIQVEFWEAQFYIGNLESHLGNFCIFTTVGVGVQSLVPDFVRFSSNFN